MRKIFFILFLLCVQMLSAGPFKLTGIYKNKSDGTIKLSYYSGNTEYTLEAKLENGHFAFEGELEFPIKAILDGNGERYWFWIEPSEMHITIDADDSSLLVLEGCKIDDEDRVYLGLLNGLQMPDDAEKMKQIKLEYIKCHPNSFVSSSILQVLIGNEVVSIDEGESLLNSLSEDVRKGIYAKNCVDLLAERRRKFISIGDPVRPFVEEEYSPYWIEQTGRQQITLDTFKGKVLLMDFWTDWCGPCRKAFPFWNKVYDRYHADGFEILGVISNPIWNRDSVAVHDVMEKEGIMHWHHVDVALNAGKETSIDYNYSLSAVPTYYIVDKRGILRAKWSGGGKEEYEAAERLIGELLKE